jgi:hypothetical protein
MLKVRLVRARGHDRLFGADRPRQALGQSREYSSRPRLGATRRVLGRILLPGAGRGRVYVSRDRRDPKFDEGAAPHLPACACRP